MENVILKNIFDILHYDVYSIFLKKSLTYQIIDEFKAFDEDKLHIYFEDNNNILISKEINGKHPRLIKSSSSKSKKYLYSFDNFSDLISFYIDIISNHKILFFNFLTLHLRLLHLYQNR